MTKGYNVKKDKGGPCKMEFNAKILTSYVELTTICITGIRYIQINRSTQTILRKNYPGIETSLPNIKRKGVFSRDVENNVYILQFIQRKDSKNHLDGKALLLSNNSTGRP